VCHNNVVNNPFIHSNLVNNPFIHSNLVNNPFIHSNVVNNPFIHRKFLALFKIYFYFRTFIYIKEHTGFYQMKSAIKCTSFLSNYLE